MAATVLVLLGYGVWAYWGSSCPANFSRFGAAVVGIALAVFAPIQYYADLEASVAKLSGGPNIPWYQHPFVVPSILVILGTLIWGYGDLLAGLLITGKCGQ
jgi:uncharacterized integral membrane protein